MSPRRSQLRTRSAPKEIDSGLIREHVFNHEHVVIIDERLSPRDRIPSLVVSTLHYNEWHNISGLFSLIIFSLYTKVPTITDFHNKCTWLGSTVYPRFFANITDTEMFVAKITTAITKASGKMFDIMEREGTLKGGSLEMKVEMSVKIQ